MSHVVSANTPHIIEQRAPSGRWTGISYAVNLRETDAKLRQLMTFNAGKGLRFRAIPAPAK